MRITLYVVTFPLAIALAVAWLPAPGPYLHQNLVQEAEEGTERVLDASYHHLGDDETPEWKEAPAAPESTRLELAFQGAANAEERVLVVHQRHVTDPWTLFVNEIEIGPLQRHSEPRRVHYPLPAGVLRDGRNTILFLPSTTTDDVTLGDIRLIEATFREIFDLRPVDVLVIDGDEGVGCPSRLTIVDEAGDLVPVYYAANAATAVREGVVYTSSGNAQFELPPGDYKLYASRGSEWSVDTLDLSVPSMPEGAPAPPADTPRDTPADGATPSPRKAPEGGWLVTAAQLVLRREVDTTGFVAADTHIHTYTFSGHGDSTVEERVVTLAGEGVELAIATDHNHNTDYRPYQRQLGMEEHFTAVVGNEVSTDNGHFNAFPLDPDDEVPDASLDDWAKLVQGMRDKGAQVVILNHPRWPDHQRGPFGVFDLDGFTGERQDGTPFLFDAMELVNSDTVENQPFQLVSDWFALLNRGERISAVGSSDSHTVGRPVGQGRTYVRSSTDDPAAIDVDEICANLAAGRSSVGMGIFADISVDEGATMGGLQPVINGIIDITLRVAAPSWVRPTEARLYINGLEVHRHPVEPPAGPCDRRMRFHLEVPGDHDGWIVAVITGDKAGDPFWPLMNEYTMAATNPVFLDVDHDGKWTSPREVARQRLAERIATDSLDDVLADLDRCDETVAIHYLDLLEEHWIKSAAERVQQTGAPRAVGAERLGRWLEQLRREAADAD